MPVNEVKYRGKIDWEAPWGIQEGMTCSTDWFTKAGAVVAIASPEKMQLLIKLLFIRSMMITCSWVSEWGSSPTTRGHNKETHYHLQPSYFSNCVLSEISNRFTTPGGAQGKCFAANEAKGCKWRTLQSWTTDIFSIWLRHILSSSSDTFVLIQFFVRHIRTQAKVLGKNVK